jgi:pyrimidine operon attenuation protein/uracil phosphoribosyltransferase
MRTFRCVCSLVDCDVLYSGRQIRGQLFGASGVGERVIAVAFNGLVKSA